MTPSASDKATQNPTPPRSKAGKIKNIGRVGRKNQKTLVASWAIRSLSPVSLHNQKNVMTDMRGSERIRPPRLGDRRAASEAADTINPEMTILKSKALLAVTLA